MWPTVGTLHGASGHVRGHLQGSAECGQLKNRMHALAERELRPLARFPWRPQPCFKLPSLSPRRESTPVGTRTATSGRTGKPLV